MYDVLKYNRPLRQFSLIEKYFSDDEISKILQFEEDHLYQEGVVTSGVPFNSRNSKVFGLYPNTENIWLFDKFQFIVSQVNHDVFLYDLSGFDAFQFTKYEKDQFYNWHLDVEMNYAKFERKMSAILMLSDDFEYTGGEFEIIIDGNPENIQQIKLNKGDVFLFASWMPHRVKPIQSGIRKTLVTWITGIRHT